MNNKLFLGLVVLAAGVLVGWYVFGGTVPSVGYFTGPRDAGSPTPSQSAGTQLFESESTGADQKMDKGGVAARVVVTYTDSGFAPNTVTAKTGTIVTFVNESMRGMWVASDLHPTHQLLPGFDALTSVVSGSTYEYTFTKVGTWSYHNHKNPTDIGTVKVTQ